MTSEQLRKWLLDSFEPREVVVRDVVQLGPSPLRESSKARAALGILEKHGWIVRLPPGTKIRGASRQEAWRIVKAASDQAKP